MLLFILNILDLVILAFFFSYDILVEEADPLLISADVFYAFSLILLIFTIKFRHALSWKIAIACQVMAFCLKIGGYMNSEG